MPHKSITSDAVIAEKTVISIYINSIGTNIATIDTMVCIFVLRPLFVSFSFKCKVVLL